MPGARPGGSTCCGSGSAEVEAADPQPGEDVELRRRGGAAGARRALRDAARGGARGARRRRGRRTPDALDAAGRGPPRARGASASTTRTSAALADRLAEVGRLLGRRRPPTWRRTPASVDADPVRLGRGAGAAGAADGADPQVRRDSVDEVLAWASAAAPRLPELAGDDERIAALSAQRDGLRADLARSAAALTRRPGGRPRRGSARPVTAELADLAMPHARSSCSSRTPRRLAGDAGPLRRTASTRSSCCSPPHPGAPARPLARAHRAVSCRASCWRSRWCSPAPDPVPTMVFDEVDAGVGGKAAVEVGRRLARLARSTPGARRDAPAAGRGLRRPPRRRREVRRRPRDHRRSARCSTGRTGDASWPG